ncbi:MAG: hypothetical protein EAZ74_04985 [Alphaproteobacteria bacterium]|nr:MAG: hypothetical protein EAY76_02940 [Alphaproteobacteria bacterium]TAF13810.1 MAG: hypothetical protein EAZ74_04985 [Alphaproteobacteria bacterium]TAF41231.1 MAG: hypothetical protein EAZ66_01730 [Alphaproteobacteria bacterium]TAF75110.1 MAG: hypothetical protein EAZ52_07425 [Alphaproteobacteria bacterium]
MIYTIACAGTDGKEDGKKIIQEHIRSRGGRILSTYIANILVVDASYDDVIEVMNSLRPYYHEQYFPWSIREGDYFDLLK